VPTRRRLGRDRRSGYALYFHCRHRQVAAHSVVPLMVEGRCRASGCPHDPEMSVQRVRHVLLALALGTFQLGACASEPRTPFTKPTRWQRFPTGTRSIRYWADAPVSALQVPHDAPSPRRRAVIYLALSGGGGSGAYVAGILNG